MAVMGTENFERVLPGKAECFSKRRDGKSVSDVEKSTPDWLVVVKPRRTYGWDYGWEYQVRVWGWPMPVDTKIKESLLGKIYYYRKILERILNKNTWTCRKDFQGNKASEELIKAVEEILSQKEIKELTSGPLETQDNQHLERESEKCDGKTGKINNEDPGLTEMIKDNEDREDAKELKHDDDKNQIIAAEMTEPQSVNDNRLKETEWLQTPDTGNNELKSTKELLELWMEYVYSTRMQEGLYDWLPELGRGRCYCGKSRMSFPTGLLPAWKKRKHSFRNASRTKYAQKISCTLLVDLHQQFREHGTLDSKRAAAKI
jgi:hypothetical protein